MIVRWCTVHDEHEAAPNIGYCWLAAVPYAESERCEFEFRYLGRYFNEENTLIEQMWNEQHQPRTANV